MLLASIDQIENYDISRPKGSNDILYLDLNEFDSEHHPQVIDTLHQSITHANICKYNYKNEIHQDLLSHVANYLKTSMDHILIVNGCDAGIRLIYDSLKPTTVWIHTPTYRQYQRYGTLKGFNLKLIPEDNYMDFVPKDDELVVICSPSQPYGVSFHDSIESYVIKYPNTLFIIDETYLDYSMLTQNKPSLSPLTSKYNNLIILKSMSKAFGLAGLRLGYVVASTQWIQTLDKIFNHKEVPCIVKSSALSIFKNLDWYRNKAKEMFEIQAQIVDLLNYNGIKANKTLCNFIIFNNVELHKFLEDHKIVIRKIENNQSRMTVPSAKNWIHLQNIMCKYFLLQNVDIWVICLNDRLDKELWVSEELKRNGIKQFKWHRPERDIRGGEFGCWESHKYCLNHSQKDYALIFEDDVMFTQEPNWKSISDLLIDKTIETFYLGGTIMGLDYKYPGSPGIWRMRCNQTHAYIAQTKLGLREDFDPNQSNLGVDDYYRLKTTQYGLIPPVCIQKGGFITDNQWYKYNWFQKWFQSPHLYEKLQIKSNQWALKLKHLPVSVQAWLNPIPSLILINAWTNNILKRFQ